MSMLVKQAILDELEAKWKKDPKPLSIDDDTKTNVINSLSIEEVSFLKPHEETHLIGKLRVAEGILKERRFTWPIFADKKTGVILDGMHRWNLLKDFCFFYIPVQHIDYLNNDNILLDVWCRFIKEVSEEAFQFAARELDMEEVPFSLDAIKDRSQAMMISPNGSAYTFREKMSPQFEFHKLKDLEDRFGMNQKVTAGLADYRVDHLVIDRVKEPDTVVIFPRPLMKQDVIDVATREEVFPPKTTRHIFQFRIFNIEVTPMELQTFENHELLSQKLRKTHKDRRLFYIGKGINIDRYYEEHMFRFD